MCEEVIYCVNCGLWDVYGSLSLGKRLVNNSKFIMKGFVFFVFFIKLLYWVFF